MSPLSCNLPIHSHLISSIPCPRMEYPPNPTSSFGYLLYGYDCHRLLSKWDSFDLDSVTFEMRFFWFGFYVICLLWGNQNHLWIVTIMYWETRFFYCWNSLSLIFCEFKLLLLLDHSWRIFVSLRYLTFLIFEDENSFWGGNSSKTQNFITCQNY